MSVSSKSRSSSVRSRRDRLKTYLATGLGACGVASSAEAGVVTININSPNISGPNAGVANGNYADINNWPVAGPIIRIGNNFSGFTGFVNFSNYSSYIEFSATGTANPTRFYNGQSIDSLANWTGNSVDATLFRSGGTSSPDFSSSNYMGFRFSTNSKANWNYGWINVTWTSSTSTFQVLGAAYESTPDTPILAGASGGGGGGGAVPEPASGAVVALLMGGTALRQWRKKRRETDTANRDSLAS